MRLRCSAPGLQRITVSLDTLEPGALRGADAVRRARGGARRASSAAAAGFGALKIDTVVMRGVNDDELVPLLEYSRRHGAELRFIEYMDVGGATRWSPDAVVSKREMLAHLETHYGRDSSDRRAVIGAGGSLQPAGRADLRDHRLDDRAVLRLLRSQPADGRWRVADVPLRVRGHRSPTAAARRRDERRTQAADLDGVVDPAPTAAPKSGWRPNDA